MTKIRIGDRVSVQGIVTNDHDFNTVVVDVFGGGGKVCVTRSTVTLVSLGPPKVGDVVGHVSIKDNQFVVLAIDNDRAWVRNRKNASYYSTHEIGDLYVVERT